VTNLARSAARAYDQLTALQPAAERVEGAAGLVGELKSEDFDPQTIGEAAEAVRAMFATVAATELACLSAGDLERVMGNF